MGCKTPKPCGRRGQWGYTEMTAMAVRAKGGDTLCAIPYLKASAGVLGGNSRKLNASIRCNGAGLAEDLELAKATRWLRSLAKQ